MHPAAMVRFQPPSAWSPDFFEGRPVFDPIAGAARALGAEPSWPPVERWNEAYAGRAPVLNAAGLAVRFVPQGPKSPRRRRGERTVSLGDVYDERIFTQGEVPSRERSWHDFFNMLAWRSFPLAKAATNARQRAALRGWAADGARALPGARTAEQDALAMLDEGGLLLLCASDEAARAASLLAGGNTQGLAGLARAGALAPMVLGHAIFEHLLGGWPPLRACGVLLEAPAPLPDGNDQRRMLADGVLARALADGSFVAGVGVALDRALFEAEPGRG
jgi:hypothetical protein